MNAFKEAYSKTIESFGGIKGSIDADKYTKAVENEINKTIDKIIEIGKTNKDIHYIKGDIAEPWHAGTIKIYAKAKGLDDIKTFVPRNNTPIDIIALSPTEFLKAQLKYYKTAEDTTKAISNPKYAGLIKIVPTDQLENIKEIAYRLYLKNLYNRPELAKHYLDTYKNASDILKIGGATSKTLTEKEAYRIAKEIQKDNFDPKLHGLNSENFVKWADIVRESGEAAINAALISAILKMMPEIKNFVINFFNEGEVDMDDLKRVGLAAISGAGEGFLRGGIAAIITASCKSGIISSSLKSVDPLMIAGVTVVTINAIHNAIGVYKGIMTGDEFAEACLRDTFIISLGICGASIGQGLIPIPILGALIGNLIGSMCATFAYEGIKSIYYSFFIRTGISFWKIVKQDYTLPREIQLACGFKLIDFDEIKYDKVVNEKIEYDRIEYNKSDLIFLQRGVIKVNTIGYIA